MLFLPYRVDRRLKSVPFVTIAIIVLNVLMFGAEMANPDIIDALAFRANVHGLYTWFTSMFMHADPIFHLGGNMYFLWLFGSVVEDAIGRLRYIGLYLVGGFASALLHGLIVTAFMPQQADIPMLGASGALAAIMGVFAVRFYQTDISFFWWLYFRTGTLKLSSVWGIGLWGVRELLGGFMAIGGASDGVASWAHIGGLAMGVAGAFALGLGREGEAGYLTEEAASYAAVGMDDIAAAKYKAAATSAAPAGLDERVERLRAVLGAATGPDPSPVAEFRGVVEALSRAGRREDAAALARELMPALRRAAADGHTLMAIAGLAEAQRDQALALEAYGAVIETYPGTFDAEKAHFRVPHVLLAAGRTDEATAYWARFAAAYPNSQWIAYADGRLLA